MRRRTGAITALYAFPALMAIGDWLGYAHSEVGSWGTAANTQVANLELLQLASVTGIAGIGF